MPENHSVGAVRSPKSSLLNKMAAGGSLVLKAIKRYLGQAGNLAVPPFLRRFLSKWSVKVFDFVMSYAKWGEATKEETNDSGSKGVIETLRSPLTAAERRSIRRRLIERYVIRATLEHRSDYLQSWPIKVEGVGVMTPWTPNVERSLLEFDMVSVTAPLVQVDVNVINLLASSHLHSGVRDDQINVGCDVDLATHYNATSVLAPTRKRQVIALGQVDAHISMTLQSAGSSLVGSIGAARSHTASALVPMKGQHASSRHLEVIITLSPVSGCRVRRYVARVPVSFVIRLLARHSDSGFRGAIQRVAHEHPSFRLLVDYEPALALCSTYGRALHRQNSVIGHVLPLLEPALTTEFFGGDIVCLRDTVQDALGARGNAIARSGRNSLIDSGALHGRGSVVPMDNSCGGSAGQRNRAVALRKPPLRETAMMKCWGFATPLGMGRVIGGGFSRRSHSHKHAVLSTNSSPVAAVQVVPTSSIVPTSERLSIGRAVSMTEFLVARSLVPRRLGRSHAIDLLSLSVTLAHSAPLAPTATAHQLPYVGSGQVRPGRAATPLGTGAHVPVGGFGVARPCTVVACEVMAIELRNIAHRATACFSSVVSGHGLGPDIHLSPPSTLPVPLLLDGNVAVLSGSEENNATIGSNHVVQDESAEEASIPPGAFGQKTSPSETKKGVPTAECSATEAGNDAAPVPLVAKRVAGLPTVAQATIGSSSSVDDPHATSFGSCASSGLPASAHRTEESDLRSDTKGVSDNVSDILSRGATPRHASGISDSTSLGQSSTLLPETLGVADEVSIVSSAELKGEEGQQPLQEKRISKKTATRSKRKGAAGKTLLHKKKQRKEKQRKDRERRKAAADAVAGTWAVI